MAEHKFACPQCGQKIQCETTHIGSRINCPACQQSIMVPLAVTPASAAVPAGERVIQIKVSTLKKAALITLGVVALAALGITANVLFNKRVILTGNRRLRSPQALRPPVEITLVAKTDSTNLRMAYAADQVIFNWEVNPHEMRVDGGPANGHHQPGAGLIPTNKYVTIKWLVTLTNQSIYVDRALRFQHAGDYSGINRRAVVFPANGSTVTVKSFDVKRVANPSL
jgi:DNA-directed RNA polymerase subunit RPC12/RpoP